jgi:putative lipoic acid-binding regulatory protein
MWFLIAELMLLGRCYLDRRGRWWGEACVGMIVRESETKAQNTHMTKQSELLDRLNDVHSFPGEYVFKVIGANSDEFVDGVVEAVSDVVGEDVDTEVSTRESSGGKHVSVTVIVNVPDAESVLEIYAGFQEIDDVRFVL